ncbi:hypothetical protein AB1Y20_018749 [Prymnesium parvum]|uniref:DDE Tnp4 domain-containing protein n=1 Tax=Prymnesium parvum TaxID=97485 RepID=A0AB34JSB2_PRYPA
MATSCRRTTTSPTIRLLVPAVRLQQSAENPGATHAVYEVCLQAVGKHSADAVLVLSSWRRWSECAAFAREKGVAKRFPSHPADTLSFLGVTLQPGSLERRRKQLEEYLQVLLDAELLSELLTVTRPARWERNAMPKRPKRRGGYHPQPRRLGPQQPAGDKLSKWRGQGQNQKWQALIDCDDTYDEVGYYGKQFRSKFRLPRVLFDDLYKITTENASFSEKPPGGGHGRGPPRHSTKMKLLVALRILATGMDFSLAEDLVDMSDTCIERFFHSWCAWVADELYPLHVYLAADQELEEDLGVYERLGLPGCLGSLDGVHVAWGNYPAPEFGLYQGKEGYTTVAWLVTCNHAKLIRHVGDPFPGAYNDKTMVQYNDLVQGMRGGTLYAKVEFNLLNENNEPITHSGAYLTTDGGLHRYRMFQMPCKWSKNYWAAKRSKRHESIRKDVEGLFGIMKKRFAILRRTFMFNSRELINNVFKTCCVLHNMLLKHDGFADIGQSERDWILRDEAEEEERIARDRAHNLGCLRSCEDGVEQREREEHFREAAYEHVNGTGVGNDLYVTTEPEWYTLRNALEVHFRLAYTQNTIFWPKTGAQLGLGWRVPLYKAAGRDSETSEGDDAQESDHDA